MRSISRKTCCPIKPLSQDRLDTLNMVTAGFAAHIDINRAHEIANDVRRIVKQLKECQTFASTYNNRERLFGLPVTSVSMVALG